MKKWVARYEEGYVTAEGATVMLADELHDEHPWESPEDAMRHWSSRADLAGPSVRRVSNGLQQTDDVRQRSDFEALHVVSIWRRVTFEPVSAPAAKSRMSDACATPDASDHATEGDGTCSTGLSSATSSGKVVGTASS